jgi:peroxiredoxin Q/BCP
MTATLALLLLAGLQEEGLKVGDAVPAFEALDDQGKPWKSSEHFGKKIVVVYFYPASFTPGCTKQACGFRDSQKSLEEKGVEVVGVSGDAVKTQELFKKEHGLNFALLADEKGEVAKAFGVATKAGGKAKVKAGGEDAEFTRGVTASRWTFVVGKDGKVAYKNTKVNAAEDAKAVAEAVEKLK